MTQRFGGRVCTLALALFAVTAPGLILIYGVGFYLGRDVLAPLWRRP